MSTRTISIEQLSKRYILGHNPRAERYKSLRDTISNSVRGLAKTLRHAYRTQTRSNSAQSQGREFWALKDVSFTIEQGEVVGIIGRNGAGKSTLLKVLSRITEPTLGRCIVKGRVASLLEVGTGFHPELTGRENIFLNGAILGMRRNEIKRKFDQIVDFSEVEKFLDTPVKRYSSGMYVRLAFAVAAHLEPDILVVDEVLAVGDAEFQKKCLGKIKDVSVGGRTVLFVSHNMAALQSLCSRGIYLKSGTVQFDGKASEAIACYLRSNDRSDAPISDFPLSSSLKLIRMDLSPQYVKCHESATIQLELASSTPEIITDIAILIHSTNGERVALLDLRSPDGPYRISANGRLELSSTVSDLSLIEGDYEIGLYVNCESTVQSFMNILDFSIAPGTSSTGVVPRAPMYRGYVDLATSLKSCLISE